jgi:hypothetical protein
MNIPALALVLAAFVNAVPTAAALHPETARIGLKEADITGTGREVSRAAKRISGAARDDSFGHSSREWREMAARCRNLARWNPESHAALISLAEEYEKRAERAETRERQTEV